MSTYRGRGGGGFSRDHGGFQGRGGGGGSGRGRGGPSLWRGSGGGNFGRGRGGGSQVSRDKVVDVTIQTNCFTITRIPDKEYYLYDISFEPEVKNFRRRQELFDKLQITVAPQIFNPRALYDGKALVYVSHLLNLPSPSVFLIGWSDKPLVDKSRGVIISLKLTTSIPIRLKNIQNHIQQQREVINNPEAATAINLLNLILRQDSNQKYAHNRKAFYSNVGKMSLDGGLELWRGFFQSVRPNQGNLLVNIDTTIAVMIKAGPLLDLCMEYLKFWDIKQLELAERTQDFIRLEKFLKKMSVVLCETTKKTRIIHGLVPKAGKYTFSKDGVDLTIEQYLKATYNITLRHPNIVGVRLTSANAERQIILPLEVCWLKEGQFYKQRLPDRSTADAVRFATLRPPERLGAIAGTINSADSPILHYRTSEYVVESGMEIDTNPLSIRGQLLPLPKVKFQNGNLTPANGGWNVVNRTLYKAAALKYWAVVNFADRVPPGQLQMVANYVKNCSRTLGLEVEEKFIIESGSGQAVEQVLNRTMAALKKHFPNFESDKIQPLLIVILPQEGAEVRRRVKYWSDIITGVLTQCIRERALERANNQYFNNIVLKLNARLRGSNFVVDSSAMSDLISKGPFIIMGADVAHPGPGVVKPSITSLVWSYDCHASQYDALVEIQHPKQEIISDLQVMVYKAIYGFGQKSGYIPKHIIFFRDGVSEGEFRAVVNEELKAIDVAVDVLWRERKLKDPKPKLTFIVVGKRHHIAFFPPKDSLADDGKGNCPAGFVNNREDLSHPSTTDFYLQSHGAIQGTSRSGHYTVIKDEIYDLDVAKIQELSFSLCHLYAKATRSVSIPAPVYYADLACARGEFHFSPTSSLNFGSDAASVSSGGREFNLEQWKDAFHMANKAAGMYFL